MSKIVFTCQMCGHCCQGEGGIVASASEQERLAAYLGLGLKEFQERYTQVQGAKRVLRTGEDGFCVFFQPQQACTVHPAKPDVCRAWPFFRGNLEDPVSWELAQDYCPGICPDSGHAEFARHGVAYLVEHNLVKSGQPDEANALCIRNMLEQS